jgi:hypothetical protein
MGSPVTLNLKPLYKFRQSVRAGVGGVAPGPFDQMYQTWGRRFGAFLRQRYVRLTRGGGEWAPNAPSTIAGKKKGRGILVRLGYLYRALFPGALGNLFVRIPGFVRFGFSAVPHPESNLTFAELARIHQLGAPAKNIPARPIIVPPGPSIVKAMQRDAKAAIQITGKQSQ